MAIVLITHDLGIVAEYADDVAVMYAGRVVESAPSTGLFDRQAHPYTAGLLRSMPTLEEDDPLELPAIPGMAATGANLPPGCAFHPRCSHAWQACQTEIPPLFSGRRRASGRMPAERPCQHHDPCSCRPPTISAAPSTPVGALSVPSTASASTSRGARPWPSSAKAAAASPPPAAFCCAWPRRTAARIRFEGTEMCGLHGAALRTIRRRMQIVFQDPGGSFNPRMSVAALVAEPLHLAGASRREQRDRGDELLPLVGLAAGLRQPLPARVQRRPAPAHRHRPRARARAPTSSSATSRSPPSTSLSRPRS